MSPLKAKRIIGLDLHPDLYTAAALPAEPGARPEWTQDRLPLPELESWAGKHLRPGDHIVIEASGNTFEVAARLKTLGHTAIVLESAQAGKIQDNYCNDDKHSAQKLARVYQSGLAKTVWTPDAKTREHREIHYAHRNAVKDATRARNRIRSYLNEHCIRLKKGTELTKPAGKQTALKAKPWSPLQAELLGQQFDQLQQAESRRKSLEKIMVKALSALPKWARLWRVMGIRHRVAFALLAILGEIERFANPKKLTGYLGLAPGKNQSGNDAKGVKQGIGHFGRSDVRNLLIQSAQNALNQRQSPLHKWGWKLLVKKSRNEAAAAVARKLAVAIWHLLKGNYTQLEEETQHLKTKLLKLATVLGAEELKTLGYESREAYASAQIKQMQLPP